jgi:hypothetical protein
MQVYHAGVSGRKGIGVCVCVCVCAIMCTSALSVPRCRWGGEFYGCFHWFIGGSECKSCDATCVVRTPCIPSNTVGRQRCSDPVYPVYSV